jgi:hypothetical protein
MMYDALLDFPPEALLQRPGLLEAVMNVATTMFASGVHGMSHRPVSSS